MNFTKYLAEIHLTKGIVEKKLHFDRKHIHSNYFK